jgi:hypothetical protein
MFRNHPERLNPGSFLGTYDVLANGSTAHGHEQPALAALTCSYGCGVCE